MVSYGPGGFRNLSVGVVDDVTLAIPAARRLWVSGCYSKDRYHLAYSRARQTANDRVLVFNEKLNVWESVDVLPRDTTFLVPFYSENRWKILGLSGRGFYEYCKPGQGSVSFSLTTREFEASPGTKLVIGACGVVCDDAAGASITVKRFTPCESASAIGTDGTISVDVATPRAFKFDQTGVGAEGASFYLQLSVTAPAGWRLYRMCVEMEPVDAELFVRD